MLAGVGAQRQEGEGRWGSWGARHWVAGLWGELWSDQGVEEWNDSTAHPRMWEFQSKFSSFGFECNVLFSCQISHFNWVLPVEFCSVSVLPTAHANMWQGNVSWELIRLRGNASLCQEAIHRE